MSDENETSARILRQRGPNQEVRPKGRRRSFKLELPQEPNIEDIYKQVNAKADFNPTSLETIYECPKGKSEGLRDVMGVVKLKRHFRFTPFYNPSKIKIKMRKTKSKKLKRVGVNSPNRYTITLEQVEKALQQISEDENEENCQPEMGHELTEKEKQETENKEKLDIENLESVSPTVVEMKEEEPVDACKAPVSRMEDFLQFESDEMLSPIKLKIDKNKRNKRRSGRIQPLCLSNILNDSSLEHIDKKICSDTGNNILNDSCAMHVDTTMPNKDFELSPKTLASTSMNFRRSCKTERKPKRRNSGINRSIYRTTFISSSPDSHAMLEEDKAVSLEREDILNNRLLSPTTLLNKLSLCSPESASKTGAKRARRKSARLSLGDNNKPSFGSLWLDSKSPQNACNESLLNISSVNVINDNFNKDNNIEDIDILTENGEHTPIDIPAESEEHTPIDILTENGEHTPIDIPAEIGEHTPIDIPTEIGEHTPIGIRAESGEHTPIHYKRPNEPTKVDALGSVDSPILSAIFDCKARLDKDRKFKVSKGSNINLSHFVPVNRLT